LCHRCRRQLEKPQQIFERIIAVLSIFFVISYAISFAASSFCESASLNVSDLQAWGYPVTTAISLIGSLAF